MTGSSHMLTIDQALYGYADGHRQLAASILLSSNDAYELATKSDIASNARLGRDDNYVSGFTLKESGIFAFIKTWPAPEMPRPGCVWSHVLLLPRKFLFAQVNLGVLQSLFRRPDPAQRFAAYGASIQVKRLLKSTPANRKDVQRIISAFYEGKPLLYADLPGENFEKALLAVWSQQWPKLRSQFVFRTVFGSATVLDKGLIVRVESPSGATSSSSTSNDKMPLWLSAALDDATSSTITPLRRFLWRYGKDVANPRAAFRHLVELYLNNMASSTLSPQVVLKTFPKPLDAATLKRDMLGVTSGALALSERLHGQDFVTLALQGAAVSTGLVKADEIEMAVSTFDQPELKSAAIALAQAEAYPPSHDEVVVREAVSRYVGSEALSDDNLSRSFVTSVLVMRPELIDTFDTARLDENALVELLAVVTSKTAARRLIGSLMLWPPSATSLQLINRWLGEAFVEAVRHSTENTLHELWQRVFADRADEAISKGLGELSGSKEVCHAARLIDFSTDHQATPFEFLEACNHKGPSATTEERTELDAYLLIICMKWNFEKSMPVVSELLPRLRRVALDNGFSSRTRALLDQQLPHVSDSWDLNKRLLKMLRIARRDGVSIEKLVKPLALSEAELLYVFDDSQDDFKKLISSLIWPFYRT